LFTDLSLRCSVVFCVTLRLLVINISSCSPAINAAAYYTSDVSQLARRWPWSTGDPVYNTWPVAALAQAVKPESRFLPTTLALDAPFKGGGGSRRIIPISFGMEKLEWCGYPMVKKNSKISLFVLTECTNVTDTRTDRRTDTA